MSEIEAHIPTVQYGFITVRAETAYDVNKVLNDPEFQQVFDRLTGRKNVGAAAAGVEAEVVAPEVAPAEVAGAGDSALTPLEKARQRMAQKKGV